MIKLAYIIAFLVLTFKLRGMALSWRENNISNREGKPIQEVAGSTSTPSKSWNLWTYKQIYLKIGVYLFIGATFIGIAPYWVAFIKGNFYLPFIVIYAGVGVVLIASSIVNLNKDTSSVLKGLFVTYGLLVVISGINAFMYMSYGQEDNFLMWGYSYEKGKSQHETIMDQTPKYEKYKKSQALSQQPASPVHSDSDWTEVTSKQSGKRLVTIHEGEDLHIKKGNFSLKVAGLSEEIKANTRKCTLSYNRETKLKFDFSGDKMWYKITKS